jgi:hypothetical protein
MKKFLKNIFLTIQVFQNSAISVLSVLIFSSIKHAFLLSDFKKNRKSNSCLILGNGPSLKNDIDNILINNENNDFIVVNNFSCSEYFEILKPEYYVIIDSSFWREDTHEENIAIKNQTLENLVKKTKWDLKLLIPYEAFKTRQITNQLKSNKYITVHVINTIPVDGFKTLNYFFYKNNLGMPFPINVLIPCILLAININYKTIYLYGTDHSWFESVFVNDDNRLLFYDRHFYDKDEVNSKPVSFYLNATERGNISTLFLNLHKAFDAYYKLNEYSKDKKIQIFNKSSKSYIDAFDRK